MKNKKYKLFFWTPRIITILLTLFITVFALDVFGAGYQSWELMAALFIHLIPTLILTLVLVIAWREERAGAVLLIALSIIFLLISRGEGWIISLPLLAAGVLFLISWMSNVRPRYR